LVDPATLFPPWTQSLISEALLNGKGDDLDPLDMKVAAASSIPQSGGEGNGTAHEPIRTFLAFLVILLVAYSLDASTRLRIPRNRIPGWAQQLARLTLQHGLSQKILNFFSLAILMF
jgi:hypothetical protein